MSTADRPSLHSRTAAPASQWSLILALGADATPAQHALGDLSVRYAYPAYACLRRCGQEPALAQTRLQEFLGRMAKGQMHASTDGSFRCFLLAELLRFLQRSTPAPIDLPVLSPAQLGEMEARYREHGGQGDGPETAFDRDFARELVQRARQRLSVEASRAGREMLFDRLAQYLTREPVAGDYDVLSRELELPPLALVSAIRRLRQRFRELVERELAETVADREQLVVERQVLHTALQGRE